MQMKMPDKPGAAQPVAATVTLDTFLHNFSVPRLMDKIADLEQHNLRAKIAAMSRPQNQQSAQPQKPHAALAFVQDLQLVDKLLISFQRQAHGLPSLQTLVGGMQSLTLGACIKCGQTARSWAEAAACFWHPSTERHHLGFKAEA